MKNLFSIIIPVYNVEKYLRECLDSVLMQNYTEFEVICVNDGSTDKSLNILNEYKTKYNNLIVIDKKNSGTAAARNEGMRAAKGEYIWFVDSDDWILPDALSVLDEKLKANHPEILCFNGKLKYESNGKEEEDTGVTENNLNGWEYYNKYALTSRKFHFVCVVLRLYKREFLLKNNLFFESGIAHEDNLWVPKVMYYTNSVDCIPHTLYVYRIRSGSKMQTFSEEKIFDIIKVANKLSDFFIPKADIDKTTVYREIAGEYFTVYMSPKADVYGKDYSKVKQLINWSSFREVSVYPRHKRIYKLLKVHPIAFRIYIKMEQMLKESR
ncbi:Glycosyl transferase, family 2/glycosyl transferase family 8 [uncultured Paludibacter sp.]|nr:Glycosyl transferase, family 2/glycosyl transferase family 8 [uncultured Paludibacter sp.]